MSVIKSILDYIFNTIEKFGKRGIDRRYSRLDPEIKQVVDSVHEARIFLWRQEANLFYSAYKKTILEKAAGEANRAYYEKQFFQLMQDDAEDSAASLSGAAENPVDKNERLEASGSNDAAFLGPVWFLYHKMYKECALLFLLSIGVILLCLPTKGIRTRRRTKPQNFCVILAVFVVGALRAEGTKWLFESLRRKITHGFLEWPGYRFRMSLWVLLAWCGFYAGVVWGGLRLLCDAPLTTRLMSFALFHAVLGLFFLGLDAYEKWRAKRYQKAAEAKSSPVERRSGLRKH